MRIIFMGNPDFAVPSLKKIAEAGELVAVVTNPERPIGRGRRVNSSAVAQAARELGIPLLQPDSLTDPAFVNELESIAPDLFVVVAFRILPRILIEIPKLGSINLHGSLLPRYRGAAPIQWALINGDKETGLTTFLIKPRVDTGDILHQVAIPIEDDDDYGSLAERMSQIGSNLLVETVKELNAGKMTPVIQDESLVTKAPKITSEMCRIDWTLDAVAIRNRIRGFSPRPGAYTDWDGKRLKIFSARTIDINDSDLLPGTVSKSSGNDLLVQTGQGQLKIVECQLEGKRRMTAEEFLRGVNVTSGLILGKQYD